MKPINELTDGVKEIAAGNLEKQLDIKTNDELETLANDFNLMTGELKRQMTNLTKVTAEKERISTELDVATRIQASMLPKDFSADERVDLFATMTPAKEVGGVRECRGDYKPAKFYCRAKKPRRLENCD